MPHQILAVLAVLVLHLLVCGGLLLHQVAQAAQVLQVLNLPVAVAAQAHITERVVLVGQILVAQARLVVVVVVV